MKKENSIIDFVEINSQKNVCISYGCSTCGSMPFCMSLAKLPDFYSDLIDTSIRYLVRSYKGRIVLYLIFSRIFRDNKDNKTSEVLMSWMMNERIMNDLYFVDYVLFDVVRFNKYLPAAKDWVSYCRNQVLENNYNSLTESLIYVLGSDTISFHEFYDLCRELSHENNSILKALANVGLITIPKEKFISPEKSKRATKNIFGAIRRNDIKAVEAMLEKKPDLTVVNDEGMSALEYAKSLGRDVIEEKIANSLKKKFEE